MDIIQKGNTTLNFHFALGDIAQLAEQQAHNLLVDGSNPSVPTALFVGVVNLSTSFRMHLDKARRYSGLVHRLTATEKSGSTD